MRKDAITHVKFSFDSHILDTDRRELRRDGALVAMQPQVFDLLVHLLKHRDHVVSRDDLIALVGGGRIVSDSTLDSRINAARNAVGDSGKEQKLIRTIPRKGVRFVGAVSGQSDGEEERTGKVRELGDLCQRFLHSGRCPRFKPRAGARPWAD